MCGSEKGLNQVNAIEPSWFFFLFLELNHCFRYKIKDLAYAQQYLMFAEIAICLEYDGDCEVNQTIFDNTILYKTPCNMDMGFIVEGLYIILYIVSPFSLV